MTTIKRLLCPLAVILVLFLAGACGYQFSGLQKIPFGVHRFHVAVLENKTMEIGAEVLFANDLMNELTRDGRLRLTPALEAEGLFTGVIKLMDIETVARKDGYAATERRVKLTVDMELKDPAGRILWVGKNITASETYLVVPEKPGTEYNRKIAVAKVSKKIAQKVFQQLNWNF
ncbi:MAG: hypothetical protein KKF30_02640 [Proteobacteria bacterium]|nr:hypothetical protein [Pseudomonadota bacterium]MBU4472210.1 hypothetical protein [Pseudomonadota bacterium]MCG2750419.1 LPS assembly lipoprotein LptE [Desulfobacteraceae bacterium]